MKKQILKIQFVTFFLASTILFASCSSTTTINSVPNNAKVYLNGEYVGLTPYTHSDTKILGTTTQVRLEKEGYEDFNNSFSRNEEVDAGAIIGGIFVWIPFLWTMKYKPSRTYEMQPIDGYIKEIPSEEKKSILSKADQLRELKALLDEGLITKEEYEKERLKILEN